MMKYTWYILHAKYLPENSNMEHFLNYLLSFHHKGAKEQKLYDCTN